jgi:hypothetical protein
MHRVLNRETSCYHVVRRFERLPCVAAEQEGVVHGRVVCIGLSDRSPDAMYAVIESVRGNGYYVPLWQSELDSVREGDLVSLRQLRDSWSNPIDDHLKTFADLGGRRVRAQDVLVAVNDRLRELAAQGIGAPTAEDGWLLPADFAAQIATRAPNLQRDDRVIRAVDMLLEHVERDRSGRFRTSATLAGLHRRLRELATQNLASRVAHDGAWRIRPDLMAALQQLERSAPKARVALRREELALDAQVH